MCGRSPNQRYTVCGSIINFRRLQKRRKLDVSKFFLDENFRNHGSQLEISSTFSGIWLTVILQMYMPYTFALLAWNY